MKKFKNFIDKFEDNNIYYNDFDFVTNSQLNWINKSPLVYKMYRDNPHMRQETPALMFGRAFHLCILEPERFVEEVMEYPEVNRRTKDGKETIANFEKEHKGEVLLKKEDMNTVLRMRNKIYSYEECDTLLNSGGIAEQVSVWEDKDTGVLCKCKADYVNLEEGYIVDIKTTTDANPDTFVHTIRKYGYDKQSAFYSDAFGVKDFYFIVIEKTNPYNIGVYKCSEETMNTGRIKYKNLLCVYKDYFIEKNYEIESFLWQREI